MAGSFHSIHHRYNTLQSQLFNIQLTPGPTGMTGPQGDLGFTGPQGDLGPTSLACPKTLVARIRPVDVVRNLSSWRPVTPEAPGAPEAAIVSEQPPRAQPLGALCPTECVSVRQGRGARCKLNAPSMHTTVYHMQNFNQGLADTLQGG